MRKIMYAAVSLTAVALLTAGTAGIAAADDDLSGSVSCGSTSGVLTVPVNVLNPARISCSAQSAPAAAPSSDD
ncbi:hypothetical protein ACFO3J_17460 [Streptomyces polygonati]|uniref:Chaplin domain-containing protein n=1 Tax=Streptomyces polygonati TaxID=1617087 RepID=A0ABV8HR61_9ACTN